MAGQLHCRVIKIDCTSAAALQATARSNQPFVPGTHLLAWFAGATEASEHEEEDGGHTGRRHT